MFPEVEPACLEGPVLERRQEAKPPAYTAMAIHTALTGLATRREREVAERSSLDTDEEAVDLEEAADEGDEGRVGAVAGPGLAGRGIAHRRGDGRDATSGAPADAAPNGESGRRARVEQLRPRIPSDVPGPDVARAVQLRVRRHGERQDALPAQHARDLGERSAVVLDVFEHLPSTTASKLSSAKGSEVRSASTTCPGLALGELDGLRRDVGARHVVAELDELPRERPCPAPPFKTSGPGPAERKRVEEQPLPSS